MINPTRQPYVPKKGDPLSAKLLGDAALVLREMMGGGTTPTQIGVGPQIRIEASMRVEAVKTDYLECRMWSWTEEDVYGEVITVALPFLARRTYWETNGRGDFTYVYTSDIERTSSGDDDEDQEIVPAYEEGTDIIIAAYGLNGGTGVADEDGFAVMWRDTNEDGRTWGKASA